MEANTTYQDNKSAMSLEENGKHSSGRRTRVLNVHCFMTTDQAEWGNACIKCCPADNVISHYVSEGLQGVEFNKFRKDITVMNAIPC